MASKYPTPNLDNATPAMIVDELAKLSIVENYVKKYRKFYKEALLSRIGYDKESNKDVLRQSGENFIAKIEERGSSRFDQSKFKEDYPDLYAHYTKDPETNKSTFVTFEPAEIGNVSPKARAILDDLYAELELGDPAEELP